MLFIVRVLSTNMVFYKFGCTISERVIRFIVYSFVNFVSKNTLRIIERLLLVILSSFLTIVIFNIQISSEKSQILVT